MVVGDDVGHTQTTPSVAKVERPTSNNPFGRRIIRGGHKRIQKIWNVVQGFFPSEAKLTADLMGPAEIMAAPMRIQQAHRYNVLGGGYRRFSHQYEKGSLLGTGGYGKVYEVREMSTGKMYACKVVNKPKLFDRGEQFTMMTEINIMKRLKGDPQVLALHDVMEDHKHLILILELCRGSDILDTVLADFDSRGSFSEVDAATIFRGMLQCVQACHDRGVIHRDVKPENFLWDKNCTGEVLKIADFGMSIVWNDGDPPLTNACGTALYMAPETWKKRPYTTEIDVWGLGVSLHLLLTGKYPFDGDSPRELADVVCNSQLPLEDATYTALSKDARSLLCCLLEKDQAKRITIAQALSHPWVLEGGTARTTSLTGCVRTGVEKIVNMNELHEAILVLMAKHAMKSSELRSLQKQFYECDKDRDGKIGLADMKHNMNRRGSLTSEDEVGKVIQRLDCLLSSGSSNCDGTLSFEQFVVGEIHFRAQADSDTRMKKAFNLLDSDGDGAISRDDLDKAMMEADMSWTPEVERIFAQFDTDGDGCISFDNFSQFWEMHVKEDIARSHRAPCKKRSSLVHIRVDVEGLVSADAGDGDEDGVDQARERPKRSALHHRSRDVDHVKLISRRNRTFRNLGVAAEC